MPLDRQEPASQGSPIALFCDELSPEGTQTVTDSPTCPAAVSAPVSACLRPRSNPSPAIRIAHHRFAAIICPRQPRWARRLRRLRWPREKQRIHLKNAQRKCRHEQDPNHNIVQRRSKDEFVHPMLPSPGMKATSCTGWVIGDA